VLKGLGEKEITAGQLAPAKGLPEGLYPTQRLEPPSNSPKALKDLEIFGIDRASRRLL